MTPHRLKLFCFPCAGASAAHYLRWRRLLPPWLDIRPVELPGRGARASEPFDRDFESLARKLTEEIASELDQNYVLFGHSLGGLLAYGCAHRLKDLGLAMPQAIIVSCCAAPSRRDDARFSSLINDNDVIYELKRLSGTPEDLFEHPDLLRMTLDAAASDFAVCASFKYEQRPPLGTKLYVLGGKDDEIDYDSLAAWQEESSLVITLDMFDGGHFFMRRCEQEFLAHLQSNLRSLDH